MVSTDETILVVAEGFFDSDGDSNAIPDSGDDVNICTNAIDGVLVSCALLLDTGGRFFQLRRELDVAVVLEAGSGGNEAADDHVLLEAAQVVDGSVDAGFRENTGGLLEAGRGDERVSRERSLGDAQEQRTACCGASTVGDNTVVLFAEAELIHLLFEKERGVANFFDFDPAHHLPGNGFDVLVVDVHALETIDLLNSVHEIGLRELFSEHGKQVVQVERAIDQSFAGLDMVRGSVTPTLVEGRPPTGPDEIVLGAQPLQAM